MNDEPWWHCACPLVHGASPAFKEHSMRQFCSIVTRVLLHQLLLKLLRHFDL